MIIAYYELSQLSLQVGFWNLVPSLLILGAGMPFLFVTMTSMSLATIPREQMTHGTSIYTLARLVGGNIGYAMVATLVADFTQVHRAALVKNITAFNPAYLSFHSGAAAGLTAYGMNPAAASQTANALINYTLNQQAAIMAYNDTTFVTGVLLIFVIPLVFLFPGHLRSNTPGHAIEA